MGFVRNALILGLIAVVLFYNPGVPQGVLPQSWETYDLAELKFPLVDGFLFRVITYLLDLGLLGNAIKKKDELERVAKVNR